MPHWNGEFVNASNPRRVARISTRMEGDGMEGDRMTRRRRAWPTGVCVGLAGVLLIAAAWLALHNPVVDGTDPDGVGPGWTCRAPYDTVLFHNDNLPGGGPWSDDQEIGARCRHAGRESFGGAVALAVAALVLAASAGALANAGRRKRWAGSGLPKEPVDPPPGALP